MARPASRNVQGLRVQRANVGDACHHRRVCPHASPPRAEMTSHTPSKSGLSEALPPPPGAPPATSATGRATAPRRAVLQRGQHCAAPRYHWPAHRVRPLEADLVMFRKEFGKTNLASVVERVSRFTLLPKNRDRQSRPVMEALICGLAALPLTARRSITFDRGTEFTALPHLQAGLGVRPGSAIRSRPGRKAPSRTPTGGSAATCRARSIHGAHRSISEVDLRPPQRHTPEMPRLPDTGRGGPREDDGGHQLRHLSWKYRNCTSARAHRAGARRCRWRRCCGSTFSRTGMR